MLALRSRGLGSAWTTLHLMGEGEKQAAELLGIPFDKYSQGGLFPIAYTKGTDFRRAKRLPAEQFAHWNDGEFFAQRSRRVAPLNPCWRQAS